MGMVVCTGLLCYVWKAHRKMLKFPEGKELFHTNMVDMREIEYNLVLNTRGKSDLWKRVNLGE